VGAKGVFILDTAYNLELDDKSCYLGDMLGKCGGADEVSRTKCRCVWGKFKELAPILTMRGTSLRLK